MEPMKSMEPMMPMEPLKPPEAWWPAEVNGPSALGSQNGARYAFFPDRRQLLIERQGKTEIYEPDESNYGCRTRAMRAAWCSAPRMAS